jgi:hypothetical protein
LLPNLRQRRFEGPKLHCTTDLAPGCGRYEAGMPAPIRHMAHSRNRNEQL